MNEQHPPLRELIREAAERAARLRAEGVAAEGAELAEANKKILRQASKIIKMKKQMAKMEKELDWFWTKMKKEIDW